MGSFLRWLNPACPIETSFFQPLIPAAVLSAAARSRFGFRLVHRANLSLRSDPIHPDPRPWVALFSDGADFRLLESVCLQFDMP